MRICFIYGIVDSRLPLVRYVGKTTCRLQRRLANHVYQARSGRNRTASGEWLRILLAQELRPEIILLETACGHGTEAERRWIADLPNLLNINPGGNGAYCHAPFPHEHAHLLGTIADARIAEKIGMTRENVTYHRTKLGIPAAGDRSRATKPPIRQVQVGLSPETTAMLGKVHDKVIAAQTGLTKQAFRHRRNLLNIPPCRKDYHARGSRHGMAILDENNVRLIKTELVRPKASTRGFIKKSQLSTMSAIMLFSTSKEVKHGLPSHRNSRS